MFETDESFFGGNNSRGFSVKSEFERTKELRQRFMEFLSHRFSEVRTNMTIVESSDLFETFFFLIGELDGGKAAPAF